MVGPLVTIDKTPRLETRSSSVDIDLIGIAKNNNGSMSNIYVWKKKRTIIPLPLNHIYFMFLHSIACTVVSVSVTQDQLLWLS